MASTVKSRHLLILVAVLAAGSACSSDSPGTEAPKVATLSSADSAPAGSAPAESAPASAAPERPRERLDTTPEEYEAMLGPYRKCMVAQGAMSEKDVSAGGRPRPATKAESAKFDAGNRICEPLHLPLPPWEKDPANPEAKDFAREVVKCLKGKGIRYVEVSDDGISIALGGEDNHRQSITKGMDLAPECEREVAARN
jgi:hypothetical protein